MKSRGETSNQGGGMPARPGQQRRRGNALGLPSTGKPGLAYVLPFVLFLGLTAAAQYLPDWAHLLYIAKILLVAALLWCWRPVFRPDFARRLPPHEMLLAGGAGLLVLAAWILPENIFPRLPGDTPFNPYSFGISPLAAQVLILVRLAGAVVVVPFMEELFWRSFLLRYLIHPDFTRVSLGAFGWFSFAAVVLLFGTEHHRWIQGILAGLVYTGLVIRQKSLRGCVVAHGVTNLGLGLYVVATDSWHFW